MNRYVCSDLNSGLINFWNEIINHPEQVSSYYKKLWNELNEDDNKQHKKKYFTMVREKYNKEHNLLDFMFHGENYNKKEEIIVPVSDEIIKVLDALSEKLGMAIDWTSQNVIPYLEQLCGRCINYKIATSSIWLILGIICLFVVKWGTKKAQYCYNKSKECIWSNWDVGTMCAGIGVGIVILIGVVVIVCQLFDIVTCVTFPEKIILDELKSIYSGV